MTHQSKRISPFTRHILVFVFVVALALLVWQIIHVALLAFLGMLLAVLYRTLGGVVSRYLRLPMKLSLVLVALAVVGLIAGMTIYAGPVISRQTAEFIESLPDSMGQLRGALRQSMWGQYVLAAIDRAEWEPDPGFLVPRVTGYARGVVEVAAGLVLVLFSMIYFAGSPEPYRLAIVMMFPPDKRARISDVIAETVHTLRYWLVGQAVAMVFVGLLVGVGLWLVGVPLAVFLGFVAGLLEFIPYIGPVAAAIPGILVALGISWRAAVYAILVYTVVAQLESQVFTPLIQRRAVHLPPGLVILAVMVMGSLFGFLGVLVATPLTAVLVVWIKMLYVEDVLGSRLG